MPPILSLICVFHPEPHEAGHEEHGPHDDVDHPAKTVAESERFHQGFGYCSNDCNTYSKFNSDADFFVGGAGLMHDVNAGDTMCIAPIGDQSRICAQFTHFGFGCTGIPLGYQPRRTGID